MQVRSKDLGRSLRHKRKKKGSRGRRNERRGQIRNRKGMELRPPEVDRKERFGDLEIDTVIGRTKKGALHTITSDNGKEFARHEKIARKLGVEFFFARPYRFCDRGREREHERTRTAISAQGDGFRERHSGGRQENRRKTEQQAQKAA